MSTKEKITLIEKLVSGHDRLQAEWDKATAVFGTHDNPLFEATWAMFDHYVDATARLVGDDFNWLHWFVHENDCGRKCYEVTPGTGAKKQKVRTVAQLVAVIEWKPNP